jgi:hypothetical protein
VAAFQGFDDKDFRKNMKRLMRKYPNEIKKALGQNRDFVERIAKELAPKDEGSLEGSIEGRPDIQVQGDTYIAEVHAGVAGSDAGSNAAKYAVRVHETMLPAVSTGDPQMMPGPITRAKISEAGPAGGKYLSRAVVHRMKDRTEHIARMLRKLR